MNDPFAVLSLTPEASDEAIRQRYLELTKQFPPDHHPQKFAEIRKAYDLLKDQETRLRHWLFETSSHDTLDSMIEEVECQKTRSRFSLKKLYDLTQAG